MHTLRKIVLLYILIIAFGTVKADTLFSEKPDLRRWNPQYAQEVFRDDFRGDSLDESVWVIENCQGGGTNNSILTSNQRENVIVEDGILKLLAKYETTTNNECWTGSFTSDYTTASVYSKRPEYSYRYGVFEARCRMPKGLGLWPAYWLWGPGTDKFSFPRDGYSSEIDIAEAIQIRGDRKFIHAFHYWIPDEDKYQMDINDGEMNFGLKYLEDWHTWTIVWSPWEVRFYIDGKKSWERSRFYLGEEDHWRNDVFSEEIVPGRTYREHEWFPRHICETRLQMILNKFIERRATRLLPASMEVDYVSVKKFFLAPEIRCRDTIYFSCVAELDADENAKNIRWELFPEENEDLFAGPVSGTGKKAIIFPSGAGKGEGRVKFSFQMPSGESFSVEKKFLVIPEF